MVISVTGFTAARSQAIEDSAIVGGSVDGSGDLILARHDGGTINAGAVVGPSGPGGSWRWVWSQNGEDKVRLKIDVGSDDDATGPATWPTGLEVSVDVPIWAKEIEAFAVIDQVKQVTSTGNTSVQLLLGSGVIKG